MSKFTDPLPIGLTREEAQESVARLNRNKTLHAQVVRILPEDVDPIVEGDRGFDVLINVIEEN